jgi:hypothetical protein
MRVYLPCTLPALAEVLSAGEVSKVPLPGYAVTPALREWYSNGDIEELEYVAMTHAARASLRLLAEDKEARRLRVVLATELPEGSVLVTNGFDDPALVQVTKPVPVRDIKSGHVDDQGAEADVAAAVAALPAAEAGDEDARFVLDGAEGFELLWYATQELTGLL